MLYCVMYEKIDTTHSYATSHIPSTLFFIIVCIENIYIYVHIYRKVHFLSKPSKVPLDVVQLLSEFRKGVDMSGRNDFLPGSARSILTAELMAFPDVKVRRSNKELFGKGLVAFFHVVGSCTHLRLSIRYCPAGHPHGEKLRLSIFGSSGETTEITFLLHFIALCGSE